MADFANPTTGSVKQIQGAKPDGSPTRNPKPVAPDGHANFAEKRETVGQDEITLYTSLLATNGRYWKNWMQNLVKNPRK